MSFCRDHGASESYTLFGTIPPSLHEHHLFEQFVIVGLPPEYPIDCHHHNETAYHEPQILYLYPPDKPLMNSMIPHFCFPSGLKTTAMQRACSASSLNSVLFSPMTQLEEPRNSFVFLLTGDTTVYYGVCILRMETLDGESSFFNPASSPGSPRSGHSLNNQLYDVNVPRVYCLVSRFPFIKMHFHVLFSVLEKERMLLFAAYNRDAFRTSLSALSVLDSYYKSKKAPEGNHVISLSLPGSTAPTQFYCPEDDDTRQLVEWGMFPGLNRLEQEDLLVVCSYLLQEHSILVVANAPGLLSAFIFSVLILMKPFLWQCAIVPILPKKLWESVDAPIPFFMGIFDPPAKFIQGEHDYLTVDLDHNMLIRPQKYVPMLPGFKRLCEAIAHHKHQYGELQHAPLQHRRAKLGEDIMNAFKANNKFIIDEVSRAVLTVFEGSGNKTAHPSPEVNFLDDDENMGHVLSSFDPDHQAFYGNFLRTQLFSVHAHDLFKSIAQCGDDGKDQEMLGMLQQLILMEEKSKEVLQEYARCGVARLSPGLSRALNETESTLDMLKVSQGKLEGEVTKKKLLSRRNLLGLSHSITALFHHGDGEKKKGHRRTKSLSEQVEKSILSQPLTPTLPQVQEEPTSKDKPTNKEKLLVTRRKSTSQTFQ